MISLWRIFWLELTGIVRSKSFALLALAALGWMFAFPKLLTSDGTAEGAREMLVHYSLGGVMVMLVVSLAASATAAIATERQAKRLQLTLVRPVAFFAVAWGKFLAQLSVGAAVLVMSAAVLLVQYPELPRCAHVLKPVMESPEAEAEKMYDEFMKDPETPEAVKKLKKPAVLRILAQRASDNYLTVPSNSYAKLEFRAVPAESELALRLRFTNSFDLRETVLAGVRFGGWSGSVSNVTQSVLVVPLARKTDSAAEPRELEFFNFGDNTIMFRPRKDFDLLVKADPFAANLARALVEMLAMLAVVIALGILLGSGLQRAVALFTLLTLLAVAEMSPAVIEQYPDALESNRRDRIALSVTRAAERVTRPFAALAPLEKLAADECIEYGELGHLALVNLALLPLLLSLLSGLIISRKQEGF